APHRMRERTPAAVKNDETPAAKRHPRVVAALLPALASRPQTTGHAMEAAVQRDRFEELIPPPELLFDGSWTTEEFVLVGEGFTNENLIRRGRLQPHEKVLDLGSGNGQKARVLARYLN